MHYCNKRAGFAGVLPVRSAYCCAALESLHKCLVDNDLGGPSGRGDDVSPFLLYTYVNPLVQTACQ